MFTAGDKLEYGHYTVLKELGAGGMGVVYRCRDEFLQRDIAIKMLLPELMSEHGTVEIFRQEARLAAQLEHPNVVTIHNIGLENREGKVHHYIAMEFLPGGSLKQRITEQNVSLEQCLEWMKQMTVGLNYAHKRGVIHQDIKPDNIFITIDGNLKIGDFGLALIATGVAIERAVQGKGSPAYMSPELCRGDPQDLRSDIYSLGAVFYELLTYERPYKASGMIEMAMKHATAPIPSAKKLRTDVPDVLNLAIQKMMAKVQEDRYQSLSEVLAILEKLLLEMQVARLGVTAPRPVVQDNDLEPAPLTSAIPDADQYADKFADLIAEFDELVPGGKPALPAASAPAGALSRQVNSEPAPPAQTPAKSAINKDSFSDHIDDLLDSILAETSPLNLTTTSPKPEIETRQPQSALETRQSESKSATNNQVTFQPSEYFVSQAASQAEQPINKNSTLDKACPNTAETVSAPPAESIGPIGQRKSGAFEDDVTGDIDAIFQSAVRAEAAAMAQVYRSQAEAREIGRLITEDLTASDTDGLSPRADNSSEITQRHNTNLQLVWTFKTQGPIGWASQPLPSKDRKAVYIGSADGCLYALDAAKGNVLWRYDTGAAVIASPVLIGEKLLFASTNGSLHALMPDGSKIWDYSSASELVATPLVHDDSILLSSMDGTVSCINHKDGSVKWTYRTDGPVVSTPAVLEKLVFVSSQDTSLHAISVNRGWRQWVFRTDGPIVCSPLVSSDSVYIGSTDGNMYAIEAETGRLVWNYSTEQPITGRGILEFTAVTVCSEDKWLYCLDKYKGGLLWKARLHSPVLSGLTSSSGNLYAANREGWLQCFNLRDGKLKWQMEINGRLESAPVISGKTLYIGTVSGDLFAYKLPA